MYFKFDFLFSRIGPIICCLSQNIPSTPATVTLLFLTTANIFMRDLNVYSQKFNGQAVVVVHSYVEVRMYLLHEFCTKPKLIQTYNILPPKTLEFCYSRFSREREKKLSPPPPRH